MDVKNFKTIRIPLLDTDWNLTLNEIKNKIESELITKGYTMFEIIHFSIFPKEKMISVTIDDKTEKTKEVEQLITKWNKLKLQLTQVTEESEKIPTMQEMMEVNEEFKRHTGMNIVKVIKLIDKVRKLKAQGKSYEEIAKTLNIPVYLAYVLYKLV